MTAVVVALITAGTVIVLYVISLIAANAGCLDIHVRKPPRPRKPKTEVTS